MKLKLLLAITLFMFSFTGLFAQETYSSSSGEMILSFSNAGYKNYVDNSGNKMDFKSVSDAPRFTVWFHLAYFYNIDFGEHFGIYTGLSMRNIGLITMEKSSNHDVREDVKWKRRSYSLGIPLAIKIGNMDGFYLFAGGQYEWLFHYKEKEFLNSGKRKYTEWFSKRVNAFIPSVFVGATLPGGLSAKFTYALDDFMNRDYSYTNTSGKIVKPYENMDSKIYYFSLFYNARWDAVMAQESSMRKIALL